MHEREPRRPQQFLSPDDFPTPRMAIRNNLTLSDVDWFATEQADAANVAAERLDNDLRSTPEAQRPALFADLHSQLVIWRSQVARDHGASSAQAERFLVPITDQTPNIDPVGPDVGFWNKGAAWDEELGREAGGEETPATQLVAEVGKWINTRFDEEGNPGDFLQNQVTLPNGQTVNGNSLLRGEVAHEQNRQGIERAKANGVDTSQFDYKGNFIYTKTATEADRAIIREALYDYLTQLEAAHQQGEAITVEQWAEAAYLLYQSPENKKGSDAVSRVYLMALASRWMRPIPKIPDDIDWRAYTKGQGRFVEEIVALNSNTDKP